MFTVDIQITKGGYIKANGCYITKDELLDLKQVGTISCLQKGSCVISLPNFAKNFLTIALQKAIGLNKDDTIACHRQPTDDEIRLGYAVVHYCQVGIEDFKRKDGTLKKRVKLDGLWYCR